jgi:hypothetical protein
LCISLPFGLTLRPFARLFFATLFLCPFSLIVQNSSNLLQGVALSTVQFRENRRSFERNSSGNGQFVVRLFFAISKIWAGFICELMKDTSATTQPSYQTPKRQQHARSRKKMEQKKRRL